MKEKKNTIPKRSVRKVGRDCFFKELNILNHSIFERTTLSLSLLTLSPAKGPIKKGLKSYLKKLDEPSEPPPLSDLSLDQRRRVADVGDDAVDEHGVRSADHDRGFRSRCLRYRKKMSTFVCMMMVTSWSVL